MTLESDLLSMDPWAAATKASHYVLWRGDTSPCPGPYLTTACPEFHVGCTCHVGADVHENPFQPLMNL